MIAIAGRRLTEAQRAMAAGHFGLARAVARHCRRATPWLGDEAESAAMLALCVATLTFDPARRRPFDAYARFRVARTLDTLRSRPPRGDDDGLAEVADRSRPAIDRVDDRDLAAHVLRRLRRANRRHARAIRLTCLGGLTLAEAGARMGIAPNGVNQFRASARRRLNPTGPMD